MLIAGLLIGGVLKGTELVGQARSKNVISDFNSLLAAVQIYRDRYLAFPGDDAGAAPRWGAAFGAKSGTGDGVVNGKYQDRLVPGVDPAVGLNIVAGVGGSGESINFWWHLRMAGFVLGPLAQVGAADQPINATGGIFGVQTDEPAVAGGFLSGLLACASNVPGKNAITIDSALDDTKPNGGSVRGLRQAPGADSPPLSAGIVVADYVEDESRYVLCRQLQF